MIYQIQVSTKARRMLKYYYYFIAKKKMQPWNADKFLKAFASFVYDKIAQNPFSYAIKKEISLPAEEYRTVNFKRNYKIIYLIDEENEVVLITNIFHNKRDPKSLKAK
ncbi:MAG TPA: type II toxin-antitoxin system RelE/ParE family toxin [Chitinophagales bacterium]|nr:type II toxin-antitoxin system RelE/ParE family toxin [Chitinophagales bacterium]